MQCMAYFEWSNDYDLGVDAMNSEHQRLIALMNRLHDGWAAKAGPTLVGAALVELQRYTVEHFANEERFMASVEFPGLRTHKGIHETLLGQLRDHAEQFKRTQELGADFFHFLKFWLSAHIRGIDRKYGDHCAHQAAPARAGAGGRR